MSERMFQPPEKLPADASPTEVANFTRYLKLNQFRVAYEGCDSNTQLQIIRLLNRAARVVSP